jgi:HK97 family phage portal protein
MAQGTATTPPEYLRGVPLMAITPTLANYIQKDLGGHTVFERKGAELTMHRDYWTTWNPAVFPDISHDRLVAEGYKSNAVVNICVGKLNLAYQVPRAVVKRERGGDPIPNHPLQLLLDRPNDAMGHRELALYRSTYKSIGGVVYLHKVRNASGQIIELWPYHIAQLAPVPGRSEWISHYLFDPGGRHEQEVPIEDVVALKWPLINPANPILPWSPLQAVAREVDSDNEATRYMYALLKNDATPRTLITLENEPATDTEKQHLRQVFETLFGGDNRGRAGYLPKGTTVERLALNLEELAFEAIRRVPEDRICSEFGVPTIIAGVSAGQVRTTYNNMSEARTRFFEDTIAPHLDMDADELTADLGAEFGGVIVEYDYSNVKALQENEVEKSTMVSNLWTSGLIKLNEARVRLGLDEVGQGDTFVDGSDGETEPPPPQVSIEQVNPLQLMDEAEDEDANA